MPRQRLTTFNNQIYADATEWFIDCRAGDLDEPARREFDGWLRKSPEHLSAYIEIAAIWNEGSQLDPHKRWKADELITQAKWDRDNVVALPSLAPSSSNAAPIEEHRSRTPTRRLAIAASIAAVTVLAGTLLWAEKFRAPTYSTAIGEQRSWSLPDGSTVELNARSKVQVSYSGNQRQIELLEGQALFHVAKDPSRPFIVSSGETRVRAVGTQFDVYKKSTGTVVTVVEGQVAIVANKGPEAKITPPTSIGEKAIAPRLALVADKILLSAGQQLTVTPKTVSKVDSANVSSATAWTQRQLVFDSASLSEVAEEFNRYNERQLIIQDPTLETFHISGVFSSTDPSSIIRFLRERPGLHVVETAAEIRIEKNNS